MEPHPVQMERAVLLRLDLRARRFSSAKHAPQVEMPQSPTQPVDAYARFAHEWYARQESCVEPRSMMNSFEIVLVAVSKVRLAVISAVAECRFRSIYEEAVSTNRE